MNRCVFQYHRETVDPKYFSITVKKLSHYVFKTFINVTDIGVIFDNQKTPSTGKSKKPKMAKDTDNEYEMDMAIFDEDVKEYVNRRNFLRDRICRLYSVIWG